MQSMFQSCSALTELDLSNFNTFSVTNMQSMFQSCRALTELDLSNFNTSSVTNMSYMFMGNKALTTIYVSDFWKTDSVTNSINMFQNCTSLAGGAGTTFDSNHLDKEYARIDEGTSIPGYFTSKNS